MILVIQPVSRKNMINKTMAVGLKQVLTENTGLIFSARRESNPFR